MKAVKHTIEITIQFIDGIQVWDHKRQPNNSLKKLNKITAIVAISRNRKTTSTGSSLPLQPASGKSNLSRSKTDASIRYMAPWDPSFQEKLSILLKTNLHPLEESNSSTVNSSSSSNSSIHNSASRPRSRSRSKSITRSLTKSLSKSKKQRQVTGQGKSKDMGKSNASSENFDSKSYQVTVGLQRGDEFIVIAASVLTINGPVDDAMIKLPLCPVGVGKEAEIQAVQQRLRSGSGIDGNWNLQPIFFHNDSARQFGLAKNAFLGATVSVHNPTSYYQKQIQVMSENAMKFAPPDSKLDNSRHIPPPPPLAQSRRQMGNESRFINGREEDGNGNGNGPYGHAQQQQQQHQDQQQQSRNGSVKPARRIQSAHGQRREQPPQLQSTQLQKQVDDSDTFTLGDETHDPQYSQQPHANPHADPHANPHANPHARMNMDLYAMNTQRSQPHMLQYSVPNGGMLQMDMGQSSPTSPPTRPRSRSQMYGHGYVGESGYNMMVPPPPPPPPPVGQRIQRRSDSRGRNIASRSGRKKPREIRSRSASSCGSSNSNSSGSKSRGARKKQPKTRNQQPTASYRKKQLKKSNQQPKTKSAMEAFGDLYDALGNVANEMAVDGKSMSMSKSMSKSRSYSSSSGDEDDDEYSSSDESSKPTIPGTVGKKRSTSVRDDLTVDSYARSLAEKERCLRERDSRDTSLEFSEFSYENSADEF